MLPVRVSELARGGESCLASSGAAANRSLQQLTASHCCVRGGRSSECTTIGDMPPLRIAPAETLNVEMDEALLATVAALGLRDVEVGATVAFEVMCTRDMIGRRAHLSYPGSGERVEV